MTFNSSDSLKADLDLLYSDDDTDEIGKVSSVSEYIKIIDGIEDGTFYRGQGDARWRIMSSLTRATTPRKDDYRSKKKNNSINFEKLNSQIKIRINDVFNTYVLFKNNLPSYMDKISSKEFLINSNLSTLLLAQHYGLPTRFIDLTINPLVALYFSVSESTKETEVPAAVFTYDSDVYLTGDEFDYAINKFAESHIANHEIAKPSNFKKIAKLSSYNYRFMSVKKTTDNR
ncbi:FRG domain-containing protein [Escherichia coli]|nr:FRG domain-containing protein [Escherichia coli]MDY8790059.1 FRG domain-containing protein [Escherichia coli]MDY8868820.1 FRG domain-containing protein [Escherichia coli]MDY8905461.1 FRG domain-containing protein [Escherichia coli]MDY9712361.1 FRG domain-containing protein [Escherichia coli]